ncbi:MAG: acyl carrier protein [Flavobacteriales bacterium]|nr:acyl carrier protein [Flavobacteriales bacterium]
MESSTISRLSNIFSRAFNEDVTLEEGQSAADYDKWDSLTNIRLIVQIEKEFSINFNSVEIMGWRTVKDIIASVESKS